VNALAPASPKTRKPKGEGHARRAEILAAAERIFVEHGYEGATIRKIADAVGLSSTALYMHFADKDAILHEICVNAFETLRASHRDRLSDALPPEVRMRRLLEDYVAFGFEHPNAYRLIYLTRPDEARHGAQSAAQEVGTELFQNFQRIVEQVAAEGRLAVEPRPAAQALWAGAHGVVSLMITKPYFDWVGRDELTTVMLDGLIAGLTRR